MSNTALGAERAIIFISEAHEKFYYEKLKEVRYQDVYHKALAYCLGISDDRRKNIKSIYDFKTGNVKTKCLHEGWQTSRSVKVVRIAFNLYKEKPFKREGISKSTMRRVQNGQCREYVRGL